ncbi:MAG: hypothetical protein ACK4VN_00130 [Bacteroidales bacterium]
MQNKPGAIIIEGHVQGLSNTRSLGEAGIPVIVVDKHNCIARYSKYCRKFFKCPDFQSEAFADFLMELGKRENLQDWLLLPSNDHAVYNLARNKSRLEEIYRVITPEIEVVNQIYNKENLLKNAARSHTPYPASWFPESFDEQVPEHLSFPVLIKGKFGLSFYKSTGKKAFLAENTIVLQQLLEKLRSQLTAKDLFIQELIPITGNNKTLSFTAFCHNGEIKTYWMGIKLREHPIEFGTATFAESILEESVLEVSKNMITQLQYTGVCEIEYLHDPRDRKYKLIEINARTWLWVGLAKTCGIDYAKIIYNHVNNLPNSFPTHYLLNIKWRNIYTDIVYSLILLAKKKIRFSTFFKQNKGRIIDAIWQSKDALPFFMYLFLGFNFIRKR